MNEREIKFTLLEFDNFGELSSEQQNVTKAAQEALHTSYAPYSHFNVGAAVLLENGEIVKGSNQENAAYPSGLCAERVALFYANSKYPDVPVKSIAVSVMKNQKILEAPAPPCGACRQVILETEKRFEKPIQIILAGAKGIQVINKAQDLLPLNFDSEWLK